MGQIDEIYWTISARREGVAAAAVASQREMRETARVAEKTGADLGDSLEKGAKKGSKAIEREIGGGVRRSLTTLTNTVRRAGDNLAADAARAGKRIGDGFARGVEEGANRARPGSSPDPKRPATPAPQRRPTTPTEERDKMRRTLEQRVAEFERDLVARIDRAQRAFESGGISQEKRDSRVEAARTLFKNGVNGELARTRASHLYKANELDGVITKYRDVGKRAGAGLLTALQEETAKAPRTARSLVEGIERAFRGRKARIEVEYRSGKIDAAARDKQVADAAETFDRALLRQVKRFQGSADVNADDLSWMTQQFKTAGERGGKALGEGVKKGAESSVQELVSWVKGAVILKLTEIFLQLVQGAKAFGQESVAVFREGEASTRRMGATARQFGIEYRALTQLARTGRDEFKLGRTEADGMAAAAGKLAVKAGESSRAGEAMAAWLNLSAGAGLDAAGAMEALTTTLMGQDEGLNKLGLANPQQIYEKWGAKAGVAASKMSDVQKAQAILNEVVEAGSTVQGEWGRRLEGNEGKLRAWDRVVIAAKESLGSRLVPIMGDAAGALSGPLAGGLGMVNGLLEKMLSPMDAAITRMRDLGVAAEHTIPLILMQQRLDDEGHVRTLTSQVQRLARGARSDWTEDYSELTIAELRAKSVEAVAWMTRLSRDPAAHKKPVVEVGMGIRGEPITAAQGKSPFEDAQEEVRRLQTLVTKRTELEQRNRRLASSERDLADAVRNSELQTSIDSINAQIDARRDQLRAGAITQKQFEDAERTLNERAMEFERQKSTYRPPPPKPKETPKDTESKADKTKRENAQRDLAERASELREVAAFRNAAGRPFRVLDEVPTKLREAISEAIRLGKEIAGIDEKVRDSERAAPPEVAAERARLVELRERARRQGRLIAADPKNLVDDELRETRERVDEITESFRLLGKMGVRSLEDVPRPFSEIVERISATDQQLKQLRESMEAVRLAGGEVSADARGLEQLYVRQRKELARQADAIKPLRDILRDIPDVSLELFKGMDPAEIAAVGASLGKVAQETRVVADAEQRAFLARERHSRGSRQARDAEKELTRVRADARRALLAEVAAMERSNLSDREKLRILKQLRAEIEGLGGDVREANKAWSDFAGAAKGSADVVRTVSSAVEQLFGSLTENQKKAIDGYVQMADGAAKFAEAFLTGDVVGMITGAVESIAGMVDFARGLTGWGETQEEKQRKELERGLWLDMIGALRELKNVLLDQLSTQQVRDDISRSQDGARILQEAEDQGKRGDAGMEYLAKAWGLVGRDAERDESQAALQAYFEQMDRRYGTNLAQFVTNNDREGLEQALRNLPAELQEALGRHGSYSNDAAGDIARINDQFRILGNSDVEEKLEAINAALKAAGRSAGEFQAAFDELSDLDLSTDEGRRRRDEIVRELLERSSAGGADFGSLTPEQFRQLLEEWARADGSAGGATGGGAEETHLNVNITAAQASTQIALDTTRNYLLSKILEGVTGASAFPGGMPQISPPPPPTWGATAGAGIVVEVREFNLGGLHFDGVGLDAGRITEAVERGVDAGAGALGERIAAAVRGQGGTGSVRVRIHTRGLSK